jgi:hypothetical protein
MFRWLLVLVIGALPLSWNSAWATNINAPSGLIGSGALNGEYAYLWTIASGNLVPAGKLMGTVTVTFNNIAETLRGNGNDITIDLGSFVGMKVGQSSVPSAGHIGQVYDGDAKGDAFQANINAGKAVRLGTMNFAHLNVPQSLSITLNSSEESALSGYMSKGAWGLEIDPDCHFSVGSISFSYGFLPSDRLVPDSVTTLFLLGGCFAAIACFPRREYARQRIRTDKRFR